MMAASPAVVWLRRDLRVEDNPALVAASRTGPVVLLYIWCPDEEGEFLPGRVSRWWLKQSLIHLDSSLKYLGSFLTVRKARDTLEALLDIIQTTGAKNVFFNRLYDPISLARDVRVNQGLSQHGISVHTFNGDLLYEPWDICDDNGHAFTTFKNFWNTCMAMPFEPEAPLLPPRRLTPFRSFSREALTCPIEELDLEDNFEKSSNALLARTWAPGWSHADQAFSTFLSGRLDKYAITRKKADTSTTSMLSPHLHFGELSVRKIFHSVRTKEVLWVKEGKAVANDSVNLFLRAIFLREYSRYMCFHFPFTHEHALLANLRSFPWRTDETLFKAWRQGRTGYPLIDAGMRELWATGWLHDKIRVVVSSFYVKFLQLPWRWGMKYFWDTLLDADLESDILGWQYISGSVPDGHELERIEDPQIEGYNLDPEGEYVRKWLPELCRLPTEWIHHPWDTPPGVLQAAGIELGCNYPRPIIGSAIARERLQQSLIEMQRNEAVLRTSREQILEESSKDNLHTLLTGRQLVQDRVQPNDDRTRLSSSSSSQPDQLVPVMHLHMPLQTSATHGASSTVAADNDEQQNHSPIRSLLPSRYIEFPPAMQGASRQEPLLTLQPCMVLDDISIVESSPSSPLEEHHKGKGKGKSVSGTVPNVRGLQSPRQEHRLAFVTDRNCGASYIRNLQSSKASQHANSVHKEQSRGSVSGKHKYFRSGK